MRDSYVSHIQESVQEKAKCYFHHGCLLNNAMIEIYQKKDGEKERRKEKKGNLWYLLPKKKVLFSTDLNERVN
jgi:hypothetical protein